MPKRELPMLTHGGHAEFLSAELDYEEMIALSGICRLLALYDRGWTPEQRTELIGFSADFEELAEWVGEGGVRPIHRGPHQCACSLPGGRAAVGALSSSSTRGIGSGELSHPEIDQASSVKLRMGYR
jgi:hypothetical protein